MSKTLVTGATGLVGSRLVQSLDQVLITSRSADSARQRFGNRIVDAIAWNPLDESLSLSQFEPIRAVVNLMGESISAGRWNAQKKRRIRNSRVVGTGRLVDAIAGLNVPPEVVVSASAVGYYGDRGDEIVNEKTGQGSGFLPDVCHDWELAARPLAENGIRCVTIRIGIVLSGEGGALANLLPIFKTGMAGRLGNGRQYFPWIHINDLVGLIQWLLQTESAYGVYNATAPHPVTNREFTRQLASAVHRPAVIPVPKFAVRLMLGEFGNSLFESQRVVPEAALRDGFQFQFPTLESALDDLLQQNSES